MSRKTSLAALLFTSLVLGISACNEADRSTANTPATTTNATETARPNAEAEVRAAERVYTDAALKADTAAYDRITADDYIFIPPDGTVNTKVDEMKNVSTYKFEALDPSDQRIRIYGDTALSTGVVAVKGKVGDADVSGKYRYITVWVRRNGEWKVVVEQLTSIAPEGTKPKPTPPPAA